MLMKAILGKMLCFGVLGASLVAWTGCLKEISDSGEKDDRINVWVAIPPQAYFLKAVGGEDVRVTVMVPPGTQPEAFTPGKDFMERIAHAGLVYGMGLGFEEALFKEMKRRMSWVGVIDTRRIFDYDPGNLRPEQNLDDPHAWMDPIKMSEFAILTYQGLSSEKPRKTLHYKDVAYALAESLEALDAEFQAKFRPFAGRSFYINHPSMGHFARRYGINQRAVPDAPAPMAEAEFERLVEAARAEGIGAVYVQPEFGAANATALAEALEVPLVEVDALAEDYMANLRRIADALAAGFSAPR